MTDELCVGSLLRRSRALARRMGGPSSSEEPSLSDMLISWVWDLRVGPRYLHRVSYNATALLISLRSATAAKGNAGADPGSICGDREGRYSALR